MNLITDDTDIRPVLALAANVRLAGSPARLTRMNLVIRVIRGLVYPCDP